MKQKIANYRIDGRLNEECRNIFVCCDKNESNGIITLSQGETIVKAIQKVPVDTSPFKVSINFLKTSKNSEINERKQYQLRFKLEQIFSQVVIANLPIFIELTVIQDNGSLLSSLINACTLCMSYSGLALSDFPVSATSNEGIDLCSSEENKTYELCIVYLCYQDKVIYQECSGKVHRKEFLITKEKSIEFCKKLTSRFQQDLRDFYSEN